LHATIRERGVARLEDLCRTLKVSAATVRRDLEVLEKQGKVRRVHGGAVSLESRLEEPLFDDKKSLAIREKRRIAQQAATMIQAGDTVYLDGGSTVLELAHLLAERSDITVVTNSLRAALELSGRGPRLILVGGELRRLSQTTVGALTRLLLESLHVDKAFMGTIGWTEAEGLTTTDANEAYTKELVMRRAGRVILLADASKAGKISFAKSGALKLVHVIITDEGFPRTAGKKLKQLGIELIRV